MGQDIGNKKGEDCWVVGLLVYWAARRLSGFRLYGLRSGGLRGEGSDRYDPLHPSSLTPLTHGSRGALRVPHPRDLPRSYQRAWFIILHFPNARPQRVHPVGAQVLTARPSCPPWAATTRPSQCLVSGAWFRFLPFICRSSPTRHLTALCSRKAEPPCRSRYRVIFRAPSEALGSRPAGLGTSRPSGLE